MKVANLKKLRFDNECGDADDDIDNNDYEIDEDSNINEEYDNDDYDN